MMLPLLALLASGSAPRQTLGVFGNWGAFRDQSPERCFAVARPARAGAVAARRPYAAVSYWPDRHRRDVLFIQLSEERAPDTPVIVSVGERRIRLIGRGAGVWSPDPATDRAVTAALRGERSLSVAAISAGGNPFADTYLLAGAATAIDAAALACPATATTKR